MKKILSLILGVLCIFGANAAQIANIEYVHKMIEHKWDITVPYNPALTKDLLGEAHHEVVLEVMLHLTAEHKVYGSRGGSHLLLEDILVLALLDVELGIYVLLLLAA